MPRPRRQDPPLRQTIRLNIPEGVDKLELVKKLEAIALAHGITYNGKPSISGLLVAIATQKIKL